MVSASPSPNERTHGLAAFAAAGFALSLGMIFALERVGAPDGFVEALGPLFALVGLCVIGVMTRAPNLPDFLAARRTTPAFYGGLAFAATAAGLAASLLAETGGAVAPPWRGFAIGIVIAALFVAPRWRRENASALSDVLATHFPSRPTRWLFAFIGIGASLLTALAGFDLATNTLVASLGASRRVVEGLVMIALAASLLPGGLKGLIWSDAASGGGALLILAIGAGLAITRTPDPFAPLANAWASVLQAPAAPTLPSEIAAGLGSAFFFALAPPAIGAGSVAQARGAGFAGLVFILMGAAFAVIAVPFVGASASESVTVKALASVAAWLPALALARAGLMGAARASGLDLATAYSRLTVLSSRRIALIRLGALLCIGLCPLALDWRRLDAGHALYFALAIWLAFVTPSLLLALIAPASRHAALAAVIVSFGVASSRFEMLGAPPNGPAWLDEGMLAGAAGLALGVATALLFPNRRARKVSPLSDPFIDLPLDL